MDKNTKQKALEEIRNGFCIQNMRMMGQKGSGGDIVWESNEVWTHETHNMRKPKEVHLPKALLECPVVRRKLVISSKKQIKGLKLVQEMYLSGELVEGAEFKFGFVIEDSTNEWEQIIEAGEVLPAEVLSGNLVVQSKFFDGEDFIFGIAVKIFYDD